MPKEPRAEALFQIFAARAAAELRRLRAEKQVREREEKLGRLVNSAMDAIIELNRNLNVHPSQCGGRKGVRLLSAGDRGTAFHPFSLLRFTRKTR